MDTGRVVQNLLSGKVQLYMIRTLTTWALLALIAVATGCASKSGDKSAGQMTEMSAEEQMAAWAEVAEPGDEHRVLGHMVGKWHIQTTFWMTPDAEPQTSEATSDARWIIGRRYVAESVLGTMEIEGESMPFEGLGMTGYDKMAGQYIGTWMDSMSTSLLTFTGSYDADTRTLSMTGDCTDPMSGRPMTIRSDATFVSDETFTVKMYHDYEGEPEFQCLELIYTRTE